MLSRLFDLGGKVALVSGGSRGLGRAMVLAFAEAGADAVVASHKLYFAAPASSFTTGAVLGAHGGAA